MNWKITIRIDHVSPQNHAMLPHLIRTHLEHQGAAEIVLPRQIPRREASLTVSALLPEGTDEDGLLRTVTGLKALIWRTLPAQVRIIVDAEPVRQEPVRRFVIMPERACAYCGRALGKNDGAEFCTYEHQRAWFAANRHVDHGLYEE